MGLKLKCTYCCNILADHIEPHLLGHMDKRFKHSTMSVLLVPVTCRFRWYAYWYLWGNTMTWAGLLTSYKSTKLVMSGGIADHVEPHSARPFGQKVVRHCRWWSCAAPQWGQKIWRNLWTLPWRLVTVPLYRIEDKVRYRSQPWAKLDLSMHDG